MVSATQSDQSAQSARYLLLDTIGVGGMGKVYRAIDRLSGEKIALKQVFLDPVSLDFPSRGSNADPLIALSHEFTLLASLRHPNIISVLDFGFTPDGYPYYTMPLIENAINIVTAAQGASPQTKASLLIDLLQALAYLHRRGVIHRDLKPANVLVTPQGELRVLDFGLAVESGQARGIGGTLPYMSPEVLKGLPSGPASDFYTMGLLAFQMFAGEHPYAGESTSSMIDHVLWLEPDLSKLPQIPEFVVLIRRLLAKEPAQRPPDAETIIKELCRVLDVPLPTESMMIRDSFLQGARFVGRQQELELFSDALDSARQGEGSAWLLGGESGVGKSRLVDEMRIRALIKDVLVLRGQGIVNGGLPFQLWRAPLARLVIDHPPLADAAATLKPLIPDIERLLECDIPDIASLDGAAGQQRLIYTIVDHFRSIRKPILLILEDLQWASESLEPLRQLAKIAPELPLMIIATFRNDEAPDLPGKLPSLKPIVLNPLNEAETRQLSESILGRAGLQAPVVDFLTRHTEGNALFIVEVLRSLANEMGGLAGIGVQTLPERVFTGSVQRIINARLERVQESDRSLLKLAAVMGRGVDASLLSQFAHDNATFEQWLHDCTAIAVLTIRDGHWQFAHDKIREGVLATIPGAERRQLHQRVADTILTHAGDDVSSHYLELAWHYEQSGDTEKERRFALPAAEQAAAHYANSQALYLVNRALVLAPEEAIQERYRIIQLRERLNDRLGERPAQRKDLELLEVLARQLGDDRAIAETAVRNATFAEITTKFQLALEETQRAITHARLCKALDIEARAYFQRGRTQRRIVQYKDALANLARALDLARLIGDRAIEADSLRATGYVLIEDGQFTAARGHIQKSLEISNEIGYRVGIAWALILLSPIYSHEGKHEEAREAAERALSIAREIADRWTEAMGMMILAQVYADTGDFEAGIELYDRTLRFMRAIGDRPMESNVLLSLGDIYARLGDRDAARRNIEEAMQVALKINHPKSIMWVHQGAGFQAYLADDFALMLQHAEEMRRIACEITSVNGEMSALMSMGEALEGMGQDDRAAEAYEQALALEKDFNQDRALPRAISGLARLTLKRGDLPEARRHADRLFELITSRKVWTQQDPLQIALSCYRVFRATHDPRAGQILADSLQTLNEWAAKLRDSRQRDGFLHQIPSHRNLLAEAENDNDHDDSHH